MRVELSGGGSWLTGDEDCQSFPKESVVSLTVHGRRFSPHARHGTCGGDLSWCAPARIRTRRSGVRWKPHQRRDAASTIASAEGALQRDFARGCACLAPGAERTAATSGSFDLRRRAPELSDRHVAGFADGTGLLSVLRDWSVRGRIADDAVVRRALSAASPRTRGAFRDFIRGDCASG